MSNETQQAIACFKDIQKRITTQSDPINFNIASGMISLANALEKMERRFQDIEGKLRNIEDGVYQLSR